MSDDVGPFTLLKTLGDGQVMEDFARHLEEVTAAVMQSYKKGKVTLTIEINPPKDVHIPKVDIKGKAKGDPPQVERGAEMFYVTERNRLSRRNPRQPVLPANAINMPTNEFELDGQSRAAGEKG